ncbi:uncharacterized protein LOC132720974 [Ruditapes philippinarum]|uniref:uncharacterized protein LOC132720974 n=1 Tax=Ruditapes philippinarum TaxID=129788 RepID=UPI00295A5FC7|nr:uncharacterized protein LOC132720974 [Ruditapes philippinarum]
MDSTLLNIVIEIIEDKCESQTAAVIVGVVLGAIIVALGLYAIYTTLVIRRYKKGEGENEINKGQSRKGPIYANESFMTGIAEIGEGNKEATSSNSETEYLRLDENNRDDKTYERLQDL